MTATPLPALPSGDPSTWDQALYAFLVEKGNRSGSRRTVDGYGRMLWPFFAGRTPDRVKPPDVLAYAHGIGLSGRTPSSATIGARIACLSSFYRFLIRMGLVIGNPCDALERPRSTPAPARGLSADEVRRLLAVVPDTVAGRRDRAILLVLFLTGRRRAEVIGLTAGDISLDDGTPFYAYRGKGGKRGRRELPRPAYEALRATLADAGLELAQIPVGLALAGWGGFAGRHELHVLRQVPTVPPGCGSGAVRRPHHPPHRGQAPARCRRVDRGGECVPRPFEPGGDDRLPPAARGRDGSGVGGRGGGDRRVRPLQGRRTTCASSSSGSACRLGSVRNPGSPAGRKSGFRPVRARIEGRIVGRLLTLFRPPRVPDAALRDALDLDRDLRRGRRPAP